MIASRIPSSMRAWSAGVALATLALWAPAAAAQSTGPTHEGYDPNARVEGHYHRGELGDKALWLEQRLRCNCGCGLDVHSCQFQMQCDTSPVWSERIRDALAAGQDVDAIEAGFVAEYGMRVLMAPPAEGFNLLGYIMPAVAIVMAGVLAGLVARGGTRTAEPATVQAIAPEDQERLRVALKEIDEAESPDW